MLLLSAGFVGVGERRRIPYDAGHAKVDQDPQALDAKVCPLCVAVSTRRRAMPVFARQRYLNKKTRLQYAGTRQAFMAKGVVPYLRGWGFSVWGHPLWWRTTYGKGRRPTVALPSSVRLHRRSISLPRVRSDVRGYTRFPSPLPARSERFWQRSLHGAGTLLYSDVQNCPLLWKISLSVI